MTARLEIVLFLLGHFAITAGCMILWGAGVAFVVSGMILLFAAIAIAELRDGKRQVL